VEKSEKFKYGIVLTGGIGSGKSTVASLLKLYGYQIIDADEVSRKVFQEKREEIEKLFGTSDRRKLRKIVFSDKEKLKKLEQLLHPEIRKRILTHSRKLEEKGELFFVEIPLFFEKGGYLQFEKVVVVYLPREKQIERVVKRDKTSPEEVEAILNNQIDIEKKCQLATYCLPNTGDLKKLQKEVEKMLIFFEKMKGEKNG